LLDFFLRKLEGPWPLQKFIKRNKQYIRTKAKRQH
jgi:hypothetical protein